MLRCANMELHFFHTKTKGLSKQNQCFTGCFQMAHDMKSWAIRCHFLTQGKSHKTIHDKQILAETHSDLSTISRFLCLSLLASRMDSHFCKSASLQGPGVKLTGGTVVPSFQDWILRANMSSFFCLQEGTNTLQLLLFSLGGHVLSSTQRNFA